MAGVVRIVALLALCLACLQDQAEGHPYPKRCLMAKYKELNPHVMSVTRKLQNQQKLKPSCNQGLLLTNFPTCDIKGKARLPLTLKRLVLVIEALKNMNTTGNINKAKLVEQNLEAFSILQTDLMNCETVKSPSLKVCQHHLNRYNQTVSRECLENDVLNNLLWIITEDVGNLVHEEQSVEGMKMVDLHAKAKPPAAKRPKGRKRVGNRKKNKKAKKMAA